MPYSIRRILLVPILLGLLALCVGGSAGEPYAQFTPAPMQSTIEMSDVAGAPNVQPVEPTPRDVPLPINLATALRLANARPLVIAAARAGVEAQAGRQLQAEALWLPTFSAGIDYQRHDGAQQIPLTGTVVDNSRGQFLVGGGLKAVFALTDAIYEPLAARQVMQARRFDVQTAKNDALLATAEAYFALQRARGRLASSDETARLGHELADRLTKLSGEFVAKVEVDRALTACANLEQHAALARQDWRTSSASLTRVLRLDPAAVVIPMEPAHLRVTLLAPNRSLDELIPLGLMKRPELASSQAIVRATLLRLKEERMRPLIPSLAFQGSSTPEERLGAGYYGAGLNRDLTDWSGRSDWDVQVIWDLKNLGFGNRGLVEQRRGEHRGAMIELMQVQDTVAQQIVQAEAELTAAEVRIHEAVQGVKTAQVSYAGNLRGVSETISVGNVLLLVNRPQEVVAALEQLQQAYVNYYDSVNDYNRAQFRLFHAVGFSAQSLAFSQQLGPLMDVEIAR